MIRAPVVAVLVMAGCLTSSDRVVTALELRARVAGVDWAGLAPSSRAAIERGELWVGATEAEAYLAHGQPRLWWHTNLAGRTCRILAFAAGADAARADRAVTTCDGVVVQVAAIDPALPCWRLAEVGPRIVAAAEYFEAQPLDRQWQIVAGILVRGQSEQDVVIAYGEPYNRGFDEREDGVRADSLVFLDRSGDAYGLGVTLIRDKVAAWRMPVERRFTPEAEQRRLDAMEQRLLDKLRELEQQSARQHAETVALFDQVMRNQDRMIDELAHRPPPQVVVAQPAGGDTNATVPDGPGGTTGGTTDETTATVPSSDVSVGGVTDGACTCKGWPLGTDERKARTRRPELCKPMSGKDADSCDTVCKAGGYAIGLFRSLDTCD